MVAFFLLMILGFAALAVDSFHLFMVRNELQNDADAAVLAGAGYLFTPASSTPDFPAAEAKAALAIRLNRSFRGTLTEGDITSGYWNVTDGFQPLPMTPTADDAAALRVTVRRGAEGAGNSGPVELIFGDFVGTDVLPVSASATAVVVPPGVVYPGGLFPIALTRCLFQNFWDYANNNPKLDPVTGDPYIFRIGSAYHYAGCSAGQWTSFKLDRNDTPTIRDLITNGNPDSLAISDPTWLEPGVKTTIYGYTNDCSAAGDRSCEFVTMPVIITDDVETHSSTPVVAFACVRILRAEGGSDKFVEVQMIMGCHIDGSGGGPYYGTTLPPKLVQ
jgi:hypothetical protein